MLPPGCSLSEPRYSLSDPVYFVDNDSRSGSGSSSGTATSGGSGSANKQL